MTIEELRKCGVTVYFEKDEILELNNLLTALPEEIYMEDYPLIKKIHQTCNLSRYGWHDFGEFKERDKKYQEYLKKHDKEEANE